MRGCGWAVRGRGRARTKEFDRFRGSGWTSDDPWAGFTKWEVACFEGAGHAGAPVGAPVGWSRQGMDVLRIN